MTECPEAGGDAARHGRNCDGDGVPACFGWAPELNRCPRSVLLPEDPVWAAIDLWQRWKRLRLLPEPGRMRDQPAFVVEAFDLFERAQAKAQAQRQAEAEREAERARSAATG